MKTILLNGSPKGNVQNCGSYILAKAFVRDMKEPCEIRAITKAKQQELIAYVRQFDQIIVITPNYIHSVPSGVLDFLYQLPSAAEGQSLGFIIQSGYLEAVESEIACRFLHKIAAAKKYNNLGTVVKGECAGLAIMPQRFQKLEKQFAEFGALFEQTGSFDESYVRKFGTPYQISKFKTGLMNAMSPIGNSLGWNKIMKRNQAYEQRLDKPYLD